jgi:hypothetical protein
MIAVYLWAALVKTLVQPESTFLKMMAAHGFG